MSDIPKLPSDIQQTTKPDKKARQFKMTVDYLPEILQANDEKLYFEWVRERRINTPDSIIPQQWYKQWQLMPEIIAGFYDSMFYTVTSVDDVRMIANQLKDYVFDSDYRQGLIAELYDALIDRDDFCKNLEKRYPNSGLSEKLWYLERAETDYDFGYSFFVVISYMTEFDLD